MPSNQYVTIVGGGIIGLACAWQLHRRGCVVTVIDAAPESREASWAAAGMLAPHNEGDELDDIWAFGAASLARWPDFLREADLEPAALDFRTQGSLAVALDEAHLGHLEQRVDALLAAGVDAAMLDGAAVRECEAALGPTVVGGMLAPAGQVNPRLVTVALRSRLFTAGANLRFGTAVKAIHPDHVRLADGHQIAHHQVVLATGAWTPEMASLAGLALDGEPVKGQMVRVDLPDNTLTHFLHGIDSYLVPRQGQGLVVGSTMVTAGFDRSEDPEAIDDIIANAAALLPAVSNAPIVETWTGLRPRLARGRPCIDRVRDWLTIATGHFRNGILLAPGTADLVADLVADPHGERPAYAQALAFAET